MLFWEFLQCNKRFRSFIIDNDKGRSHDFMILMLFYALDHRSDPAKQGVVRMCVFVLQTLSTEINFGKLLNKEFKEQESLPPVVRIPDFTGTYADFLIIVCSPSGALYSELMSIGDPQSYYLEQRQTRRYIPLSSGHNQ